MADNSDNKLREKLMGIEPAFDPAAWDKMEALLDNKKKRRFFIWWWTGGIAAALLLGIGVFEYCRVAEHNRQMVQMQEPGAQNQEPRAESIEPGTERTEPGTRNQEQRAGNTELGDENTAKANSVMSDRERVTGANTKGNKQLAADNNSGVENADSKKVSSNNTTGHRQIGGRKGKLQNAAITAAGAKNKNVIAKGGSSKKQKTTLTSSTQTADGFIAFNRSGNNNSHKAVTTQTTGNRPASSKVTNTLTTATNSAAITNPAQQEVTLLNSATGVAQQPEPFYIQHMEATLLQAPVTENAVTAIDKQEENVLPKARKQVFNYSLGVAAHVSGATVGTEGGSAGIMFYKSPTWMVGFTHDFTFINRIAITNGVLYGQTAFEVKQPKAVNYPVAPIKYNSHISEIAIPIGIKVYPVVKQNFRFYISTGIINHIKLKETFNYTVQDTPVYNSIANDPMGMYPGANDFTGDVKTVGSLASTNLSVSTTNDFAVSAKRYYASYYAGAGFEYMARNHFTLFAEPVFYMGLSKIGVQDKRKYNLGVTGGFRYRF